MEKKTVTKSQWENAIRRAKQYTANYDKARWIIVDIALEVCDYSHGGRKGTCVYSLKKFAQEIEIQHKTIYQWVRVKRLVFDKLPKTIQANSHKYLYNDFEDTCLKVKPEMSKKEVLDIFNEQIKLDPTSKKFKKYLLYLNSILYNAQRPILMKDVPQEDIEKMIERMKIIIGLFNKELEFRKKYSSNDQRFKRLNIKNEIQKRIEQRN